MREVPVARLLGTPLAELRQRAEKLAVEVGAYGELYQLLIETAARVKSRPDDEREVDLGSRRRAHHFKASASARNSWGDCSASRTAKLHSW